jgi:hypothetical protein
VFGGLGFSVEAVGVGAEGSGGGCSSAAAFLVSLVRNLYLVDVSLFVPEDRCLG